MRRLFEGGIYSRAAFIKRAVTDKNDFGDGCHNYGKHRAQSLSFMILHTSLSKKSIYALSIDTIGRCITAKNGAY